MAGNSTYNDIRLLHPLPILPSQKGLVSSGNAALKTNRWHPAEATELVGAHELARCTIRFAQIVADLAVEANYFRHELGKLENAYICTRPDIHMHFRRVALHQVHAGICTIID